MINIAKHIYIGWDPAKQKFELPNAEIVPLGESYNEKKKLGTLTRRYPNLSEYENIPLPGFTLFKTDRKNWGSIDQSWLVIDPRGFLVRITSQNLENILHVTGITEGLIQQECIWVREDSQTKMTLMPVSSAKYKEAVKNTELIEGKVDLKDVDIGDHVMLQNGLTGRYMGVVSLYATLQQVMYGAHEYKIQSMLRKQVIEIGKDHYYYQNDAKILKITKKSDKLMTREDAIQQMNKSIDSGNSYFTNTKNMLQHYPTSRGMVKHVSLTAAPKIDMSFEEISFNEAVLLFDKGNRECDFGLLAIEDKKGRKFLIDHPQSTYFSTGLKSFSINAFPACEISGENLQLFNRLTLKHGRDVYFSSKNPSIRYSLQDFKKYYRITKHVKNEKYI